MRSNATPAAHAAQQPQTAAARLEGVRSQLRSASREVQIGGGRLLDFDAADGLQRTLRDACRGLEQITSTVAVIGRKVC